jgi:hypothetical protein
MASTLKVNTIAHSGGTTALTVDSTGRVLQPTKPAFRIARSSSSAQTTAGGTGIICPFDVISDDSQNCFNQGGFTFSGGVVTVPVDGLYQLNANLRVDGVGSGYLIARIMINGSSSSQSETYGITGDPAADYESFNMSECFKLEAADTIEFRIASQNDSSWEFAAASTASGYLIG